MRLQEIEGSTIEDVKEMHPDVYDYMEDIIGYMAMEQQTTVEMVDTASGHWVLITIQPSAGMSNTAAALKHRNIKFEITDTSSGSLFTVNTPMGELRISESGPQGNRAERWNFILDNGLTFTKKSSIL